MLSNLQKFKKFIENYAIKNDLNSSDPYDLWIITPGIFIKKLFYKNKHIGYPFIGIYLILDFLGIVKKFYKKREYPIARALAAQSAINLYYYTKEKKYLNIAKQHLLFLKKNYFKGYSGYCWGLNQPWMSKNRFYPEDIPYVTNTSYALEAFVKYQKITGSKEFNNVIKSVFWFLEKDIPIIHESADELAVGYSPLPENYIVINANSYAMYMYTLLLEFYPKKRDYILKKIRKIYNFIVRNQEPDGSWWYYVKGAKGNFIDCFHSCFVMKNIYKTAQIIELPNWENIVEKGYNYLINNFFNKKKSLVKRFSKVDKFNPVKWDLYDNAEFLNLSILLDKMNIANKNLGAIFKTFVKNEGEVYSQVWIGGIKRYKNTLRWAVMPFVYAVSEFLIKFAKEVFSES